VVVARNPDRISYTLFLLCKPLRIPYFLYVQRASGFEEIRGWRRFLLGLGLWPRHTLNAICPDPPAMPGKTCDFLPFAMETAGFEKTVYPAAPPIAVLAVGKLDQPRKNHVALVRHTAELLRAGRIRLTLLGLRDPAGSPAFAALQDEIAAQGVADAVRLVDNLDHAASRRLYGAHDLLVLASSRERASVAPVEALAAGLPVICGADNGTNFFVRPGETGFIFPDGDFAEMARLIDGLAARPDEIRRLGLAGRRMIETEYSPAAAARRFEDAVARRFARSA
jgi:glycosyltransferase involved in cell wall biosynthesis